MAVDGITIADLARDPGEVARGLAAWRRGDADEAALQTLAASSRDLHSRAYRLWVWSGLTEGGEPAWVLPVPAPVAMAFHPRGPARALARCLGAAIAAGAEPRGIRLLDWRGFACLVLPELDDELAGLALAEAHPAPAEALLTALPARVAVTGVPFPLPPPPSASGDPLTALGHAIGAHQVLVAITLAAHGVTVDDAEVPAGDGPLAARVGPHGRRAGAGARAGPEHGARGRPLPAPPARAQAAAPPAADGQGGHAVPHVLRPRVPGAPPDGRREALDVGEALVRAGLLGEKPSVGQRHVYLRREALPEIHALIERGETTSPILEELWTAPPPGVREPGNRDRHRDHAHVALHGDRARRRRLAPGGVAHQHAGRQRGDGDDERQDQRHRAPAGPLGGPLAPLGPLGRALGGGARRAPGLSAAFAFPFLAAGRRSPDGLIAPRRSRVACGGRRRRPGPRPGPTPRAGAARSGPPGPGTRTRRRRRPG